jgi:hypothetical protein
VIFQAGSSSCLPGSSNPYSRFPGTTRIIPDGMVPRIWSNPSIGIVQSRRASRERQLEFVVAQVVIALNPVGDFTSLNAHILRGSKTESHPGAMCFQNNNLDIVADADRFVRLAGQN